MLSVQTASLMNINDERLQPASIKEFITGQKQPIRRQDVLEQDSKQWD